MQKWTSARYLSKPSVGLFEVHQRHSNAMTFSHLLIEQYIILIIGSNPGADVLASQT